MGLPVMTKSRGSVVRAITMEPKISAISVALWVEPRYLVRASGTRRFQTEAEMAEPIDPPIDVQRARIAMARAMSWWATEP